MSVHLTPALVTPALGQTSASTQAQPDKKRKKPDFSERCEVGDLIHEGTSARVHKAFDKMNKRRLIAVKISKDENGKKAVDREAYFLTAVQGDDHFPKMFGVARGDKTVLIQELLGPDMVDKYNQTPISFPGLVVTAYEGLCAYSALKGKGILHADAKPDNFIPVEGGVKLIDFGLAEKVKRLEPGHRMYNRKLRPPEVVYKEQVSCSADIFAFGCVLHEIASSGEDLINPAKKDDEEGADEDIRGAIEKACGPRKCEASAMASAPVAARFMELQPRFPETSQADLGQMADLVSKMVTYPERRIDVDDALKHTIFPKQEFICEQPWEKDDECLLFFWPDEEFLFKNDETVILKTDLAKFPQRSHHMLPRVPNDRYYVRVYLNGKNIIAGDVMEIPPGMPLVFDRMSESLTVGG